MPPDSLNQDKIDEIRQYINNHHAVSYDALIDLFIEKGIPENDFSAYVTAIPLRPFTINAAPYYEVTPTNVRPSAQESSAEIDEHPPCIVIIFAVMLVAVVLLMALYSMGQFK